MDLGVNVELAQVSSLDGEDKGGVIWNFESSKRPFSSVLCHTWFGYFLPMKLTSVLTLPKIFTLPVQTKTDNKIHTQIRSNSTNAYAFSGFSPSPHKIKTSQTKSTRFYKEEVGFEPTVRSSRTTVFKTAPINRSGTLPYSLVYCFITNIFYCKDVF